AARRAGGSDRPEAFGCARRPGRRPPPTATPPPAGASRSTAAARLCSGDDGCPRRAKPPAGAEDFRAEASGKEGLGVEAWSGDASSNEASGAGGRRTTADDLAMEISYPIAVNKTRT